jgi:dTDP-glucose 4,6-dehydratase
MIHPLAADLDHILATTEGIWEALRGQRLFITGGTGFVGTWLTESLAWADTTLNLGVEAVLLTRNPDAFRAKAPSVANHKSIRLLRGTAQSFEFSQGEFQFVIHAATESATKPTAENPAGSFDADLAATRRVLEFARQTGTRRLLFTSSGAVYGRQPEDLPGIPEDYSGAPSATDEKSAYGQAKRASEFLCTMYSRQFGFDTLIARLFAFVGPHLPLEGYAVGNFLRDAMSGSSIRIESDGSTVRSYLYAADMAAWLWTILLKGESAHPYNVGSPKAITVRELANEVAKTADRKIGIEVLGRSGVPATRYVPDTSRAERELGLTARVSLEESLRRTMAWNRTQAVPVAND